MVLAVVKLPCRSMVPDVDAVHKDQNPTDPHDPVAVGNVIVPEFEVVPPDAAEKVAC
tara:strand:- start:572 stop:742 length:171 start_codon:yes stop_codon:yes gene_type:complete